MKAWIDNYKKGQNNWYLFNSEFDHDMDELDKALMDYKVNHKSK